MTRTWLAGWFVLATCLHPAPGAAQSPPTKRYPTSMAVVAPKRLQRKGCVVAAPHEGWDLYTEPLARAVATALGVPMVAARNYRKPKVGRWFDVNRPTERTVDADGQRGDERVTAAGQKVFAAWTTKVREAANAARAPKWPVPLYIDVHGNSRTITVRGRKIAVEVIEVATVGFKTETLRRLKTRWTTLRTETPALPRLVFDKTDPTYRVRETELKFHFTAGGARRAGILQPRYVKRALHFELPKSARTPKVARARTATAIAALLAALD